MDYLAVTGNTSLSSLRMAMAYGTCISSYNIEAFSLERMKEVGKKEIDIRLADYRAMLDLS
jgi:hypothetical protein